MINLEKKQPKCYLSRNRKAEALSTISKTKENNFCFFRLLIRCWVSEVKKIIVFLGQRQFEFKFFVRIWVSSFCCNFSRTVYPAETFLHAVHRWVFHGWFDSFYIRLLLSNLPQNVHWFGKIYISKITFINRRLCFSFFKILCEKFFGKGYRVSWYYARLKLRK